MTAPKTPYEQGRLAAEVGWTTFNNHYYQFLEKEQRRDWRSGFLSRRAELARAGANAPVPLTFQQVREKWGAILRSYPNGGKLYGQPENEIRAFLADLNQLDLTAELAGLQTELTVAKTDLTGLHGVIADLRLQLAASQPDVPAAITQTPRMRQLAQTVKELYSADNDGFARELADLVLREFGAPGGGS